ncbi:rCG43027 [Rattus norvegicus]|uniref:RCG43027 n=1 Tax=Rattus norvegicus TaxID=10116 RepID=A6IWQ6_RAT|nr:rCG43027 [Rattus norvegicus]
MESLALTSGSGEMILNEVDRLDSMWNFQRVSGTGRVSDLPTTWNSIRLPTTDTPPPAGSPFLELSSECERIQQGNPAGQLPLLNLPGSRNQAPGRRVAGPSFTLSHVWLASRHFPSHS